MLIAAWLAPLFLGLAGGAQGSESPPSPSAMDWGRHKVQVREETVAKQLVAQGARLVANYGGYQLFETDQIDPALAASGAAEIHDEYNLVLLNAKQLDTRKSETKAMRQSVGTFSGKRMHLVQFAGPMRPEWREELLASGVQIVAYIPNNAYLVYGGEHGIAAVQKLSASAPHIQWEGAYLDEYKIHPKARTVDARGKSRTIGTDLFAIQLMADAEANGKTLELLDRLKLEPIQRRDPVLNYLNIVARLNAEDLSLVAAQPEVVSIQPYFVPRKADERQDQIVAGNLNGNGPRGPGYLTWLASKGFSQAQFDASGFAVDVSDSGIDEGTTQPAHFGLYVGGNLQNASRIVYTRFEGTENLFSTLVGCDGHGTINAHIIGGYDDLSGFPFEDGVGYHYGLGVCPFVRMGSSVIFDSLKTDLFTATNYNKLQSDAYHSGARISNNSWGADGSGAYTVDSQNYDALVRDAQPTNSSYATAGNQEMVIVFAAGNSGSGPQTVAAPGTGKNVITVGAADNVQPFGGPDGSGVDDDQASNVNNIANFSSRGPCADGRHKPDIMAPGTHVSGGVVQWSQAQTLGPYGTTDPCFTGSDVSGGPDGIFYPDGQKFYTACSGTSQAAPAVAGGCALVRQYFINNFSGAPSPAMTKAYVMNSARYMTGTNAGDSLYSDNQGMGELNLGTAFDGTPRILRDQLPGDLFTASGQTVSFTGTISDSTKPFRVTVAWTDAPGSTTGNAWNNDLDLTVTAGGNTYKGNVFNGAYSATGGTADGTNNVESVFLPPGFSGNFSVTVTAANINSDGVPGNGIALDQDFALVVYNGAPVAVPVVVNGGSTVTSQDCSPGNGAVNPNETVTMNFALQNVGASATGNLVATLLASGGVSAPSGPQTYGALAAGEAPVNQSFTFKANGVCGGRIFATLKLQDGSVSLGTVSFILPLGQAVSAATFTENFNDATAPALPAGWSNNVSGAQSNWVTTTSVYGFPTNAAFVPDVSAAGVSELISPAIPIASTNAQLTFQNNYSLEASVQDPTDAKDGGLLEIRIGNGSFTNIIDAGCSFVTNGYNSTISSSYDNLLAGQPAWTGDSGGWVTTIINLPVAAAGQNIQLKWRCATDTGNIYSVGGWYVSGISVQDMTYTCCAGTSGGTATLPVIYLKPTNQMAQVGGSAGFIVGATGTPLPTYQWLVNGAPLAGANSSALNLSDVQITQVGNYQAVVSNPAGSVTSSVATLSIVAPLAITSWPSNQTVAIGTTVNFQVAANGPQPPTYQWFYNGTAISGAITNSLTLPNVQPGQAGTYSVVVSDASSSLSAAASLMVLTPPPSALPPTITVQPVDQTVVAGALISTTGTNEMVEPATNVNFQVAASGPAPLSYQWFFDGAAIPGATASILTVSNVQLSDVGNYQAAVSNLNGSVTSAMAGLSVLAPLTVTRWPSNQTATAGATVTFQIAAFGAPAPAYQWLFAGTNINGATTSALTLVNVQPSQEGTYEVLVSDLGASARGLASLTVLTPPPGMTLPVITAQPTNQTVVAGALIGTTGTNQIITPATNSSFQVTAVADVPLTYQWLFNGTNLAGATSDTLALTNVQLSQVGNYEVVVSDNTGSVTSSVATLSVLLPLTVTSWPANQTVAGGGNVNFQISVQGAPPPTYQWYFDGAAIAGATTNTLSLVNVQPGQAGTYMVVATNATGAASAVASLSVLAPGAGNSPPVISQQPTNQLVVAGVIINTTGTNEVVSAVTNVSFQVTASAGLPLGYQWLFDGAPLTGAVSSTLTLTNVQLGQVGNYEVVVSDTAGSVTSSVATLTLLLPLTITSWPSNETVVRGGTVNFQVSAQGAPPPSYQWFYDGAPIAGATANVLTLANAQPGQAGSYSVLVANLSGSASGVASLTVVNPPPGTTLPVITAQPADQTVVAGALVSVTGTNEVITPATNVSFQVTAAADSPLTYQWLFDGALLSGATSNALTITNVQLGQVGNYEVVVSDQVGSVISSVATLSVLVPLTVTSWPSNQTVAVGRSATFQVTAQGAPAPSYQWYFDGALLPGATTNTLNLANVQPTQAGTYLVVVTNASGSASAVASLSVLTLPPTSLPPQINIQPVDQVVVAGALVNTTGTNQVVEPATNVSFEITASGPAPLSYQWFFNGAGVLGATTNLLSITNVQLSDVGNYEVVVGNPNGSVTSSVAGLSVLLPLTVTQWPSNQIATAGAMVSFQVTAQGAPPPGYQWFFDGAAIAGATSNILTLPDIQSGQAGTYQVIVSGLSGSAGGLASLTVLTPPPGATLPVISAQPTNQTVVAGALISTTGTNEVVNPTSSVSFQVTATAGVPLTYQWFFDGAPVGGATSDVLTVTNVQLGQVGNYEVVVSDQAGSVTSSVATLSVLLPLTITGWPSNQTVAAGRSVTFQVTAQGAPPPGYQWFFDGAPLAGATANTLNLTNVQAGQAGTYQVLVDNSSGSATAVASLSVLTLPPGALPPQINIQPVDQVVVAGALVNTTGTNEMVEPATSVSFEVTAGGPAPLSYQWSFNGAIVPGATTNILTVTNVQLSDVGNYEVVVGNPNGSVTSSVAALSVLAPLTVTSWPSNQTANTGATVTFQVAASGAPLPSYQWSFAGTNINGATTSALTLTNVQTWQAGTYRVLVSDLAASAGGVASLTVLTPPPGTTLPVITGQPVNETVVAGALIGTTGTNQIITPATNASFQVTAVADVPLTYQWLFNGTNITGATTDTLTLTNVQLSQVGNYEGVVSDNTGSVTSSVATLSVLLPLKVTSWPANQTVAGGANANFQISVQGAPPPTYQWYFDGGAIAGATTNTLSLVNVQPGQAGTYMVVATNATGSASAVASLSVLAPGAGNTPPVISQQPTNQLVVAGVIINTTGTNEVLSSVTNVSFEVVASGPVPLSYQWLFNGADVPGATANTLTITNVQLSNVGNYEAVVSNPNGSVTSSVAGLTVLAPLTVTSWPSNQTATAGATVVLQVTAQGAPSPAYQWSFDGVAIAGATTNFLILPNVQSGQAGTYQVVVAGLAGSASALASLTVLTLSGTALPEIVEQPTNQAVIVGALGSAADVSFQVTAVGGSPLSYQWLFDGAPVTGAVSNVLTITNAQLGQVGNYEVVVGDQAGSVTSTVATLSVFLPLTITGWPSNQTVAAGRSATFRVAAQGAPAPTYQWFFDGTALAGATANLLNLTNVQPAQAGTYQVVVANASGSAEAVASLGVLTLPPGALPPEIDIQPVDQQVVAGALVSTTGTNEMVEPATSVSFEVTAGGPPPLSYQWFFNGASVVGATTNLLTVTNVQLSDVGNYEVVVSNPNGSITSSVAGLSVLVPLRVTSWPSNQTAATGANVTFQVAAFGAPAPSYQWSFAGTNIAGATTSALALNDVQPWQAGTYQVVVSDLAASAAGFASLTVLAPPPGTTLPVITGQPVNQIVVAGAIISTTVTNQVIAPAANASFQVTAVADVPLTYQWLFDGTKIPGGATNTLTVTNVQLNQVGNYEVVVSDNTGSVTSSVVTLSVLLPLTVSGWPANQTVPAGGNANFQVFVQGAPSPSYQWSFDGAAITGATNNILSLVDVQPGQAGTYSVMVSNVTGSAGAVASLSVLSQSAGNSPPVISAQPTNQLIVAGALISTTGTNEVVTPSTNVSFAVTASGSAALGYQWLFNGAPLAGAGLSTLTLTNVQLSQVGNYEVVVSDTAGSVTSSVATLTLLVPLTITSWPSNQTVVSGTTVNFQVNAQGAPPPNFQWFYDGAPITGATNNTLTLTNAQPGEAGSYSVTVENLAGSASGVASLTVVNPPPGTTLPFIETQPTNQVVVTGTTIGITGTNEVLTPTTNVSFQIVATADSPLTYQWFFNGTNLAGATASDLTLTNVFLDQVGNYQVVVSDTAGSVTSSVASLTVLLPLTVLTPPLNQTVAAGSSVNFQITLAGGPTPVYQWYFDTGALLQQTNSFLNLTNVQANDAGSYTVVATNFAGSVSAVASLTVLPALQLGTRNVTMTPGAYSLAVSTRIKLNYTLEYKNSLSDPTWTPVGPTVPGTGSVITLQDPTTAGQPSRFYRVRYSP